MAKKRSAKDVSAIVGGAGLISAVWSDLATALRQRGGSDEDLYRLAKPNGKIIVGAMADLVLSAKRDEEPLGEGEYLIDVDYGERPNEEAEFWMADTGLPVFSKGYQWFFDHSCVGVGVASGKRIMRPKIIEGDDVSNELLQGMITEMGVSRYRPANHIEVEAFAGAKPDLLREFDLVGLSSFALRGAHRFLAVKNRSSGWRLLEEGWDSAGWNSSSALLFVRR